MADHRTWHAVEDHLVGLGYRVVAPDLRGHGRSSRAEYRPHLLADDLVESLPAGAAVAIGHSLGGLSLLLPSSGCGRAGRCIRIPASVCAMCRRPPRPPCGRWWPPPPPSAYESGIRGGRRRTWRRSLRASSCSTPNSCAAWSGSTRTICRRGPSYRHWSSSPTRVCASMSQRRPRWPGGALRCVWRRRRGIASTATICRDF
ncbi:alpha/beta fold hydrolase [Streptomyces sp. B-S-A12]|uniref:Alpha/beta fold hydrolase n=2 Tax=Streptomyces luteolus TaxID=3043615 RepID=A0ABT6T5F9_9ACTN|nr:alpha/beta fold hydrolase [Streptomyces sp. B-S-A12]MDI3422633.1 alpha/beta fold hydrolase [Streptomyces sp. B-S-A12]